MKDEEMTNSCLEGHENIKHSEKQLESEKQFSKLLQSQQVYKDPQAVNKDAPGQMRSTVKHMNNCQFSSLKYAGQFPCVILHKAFPALAHTINVQIQ
jgi:hypothetical protein